MPRILKFGPFEADLEAGELRKNGLRLRIQEQPFQVLTALMERPGEIVTRDELVTRLWPQGTFVDFDRGLNAAIARLRQVLNDSAENPRYLETVARKGYRFLASVEEVAGPTAASTAVSFRRRWAGVMLLTVLLVAVAALILFRKRSTPQRPIQAVQVTTEPGTELCPSLSPDGNQVAFEWSREGAGPQIYVKLVGPGDPVRLTSGSWIEYGPAWSRDGKQIAFVRKLDQIRIGVFVIPALGGMERKLTEFANLEGYNYRNTYRWLDWTPDGKNLIAAGAERIGVLQGLFIIPLDGGPRRSLTRPPDTFLGGDRSPALSPDGRVLAFARSPHHVTSELWLLDLKPDLTPAGDPRQITATELAADSPAWTPDGRELVFTMDGPGLWRVAVAGRSTPARLDAAGRLGMFPAIAPNGRLVFSEFVRDVNLWRQEIPSGTQTAPSAVRLIASSVGDGTPQYSPDGMRIAFESNRSGRKNIWICDRDGSRCSELVAIRMTAAGTPRWSPDGKRIAFDARMDRGSDVYVIDLEGGVPRRLSDDPSDNSIPSWSRDGKWVYFRSGRTGRNEIWKSPSEGGPAAQVTRNGGHVAFEATDGKSLFYTKTQSGSKLWRSALDGTGERVVAEEVTNRAFALAEDRVYLMRPSPDGLATLVSLQLSTGKVVEIARTLRPPGDGLSLSPDGRYLLYSQIDHSSADLTLLEEFR